MDPDVDGGLSYVLYRPKPLSLPDRPVQLYIRNPSPLAHSNRMGSTDGHPRPPWWSRNVYDPGHLSRDPSPTICSHPGQLAEYAPPDAPSGHELPHHVPPECSPRQFRCLRSARITCQIGLERASLGQKVHGHLRRHRVPAGRRRPCRLAGGPTICPGSQEASPRHSRPRSRRHIGPVCSRRRSP